MNDNPVNLIDPNGQKGFSVKGFVSNAKSAASRAASTVKSIAKSVSPKATVKKVISSGSKIAANIKAGASKVTAKVQQGINKAVKTVRNVTSPKTIRQKTRAAVSGAKATISSIKKMVSGKISKAEKFAGTQKLALLSAAKTAKGAMVKYAVPIVSKITNVGNQMAKRVGDVAKFQRGSVLKLYDSSKNSLKSANGKAAAFGASLSRAITSSIGRTKPAEPQPVTKRISSSQGTGKTTAPSPTPKKEKTWDQKAGAWLENHIAKPAVSWYVAPPKGASFGKQLQVAAYNTVNAVVAGHVASGVMAAGAAGPSAVASTIAYNPVATGATVGAGGYVLDKAASGEPMVSLGMLKSATTGGLGGAKWGGTIFEVDPNKELAKSTLEEPWSSLADVFIP